MEKIGVKNSTKHNIKQRRGKYKKHQTAPKLKKSEVNMFYNNNQRKEKARILIITGNTLKDTANQTGLSIDQVKKMSAKENLQEKQRDFLNKFYMEHWEKIKHNKEKRIKLNNELLENIYFEIKNGNTSKEIFEKLMMTEQTEQLIFENDKILKYEELEIKKMKIKQKSKHDNNFITKIEKALSEK